jgi:hypothetical protein
MENIEKALILKWSVNNRDFQVEVSGTSVTHLDALRSWFQKDKSGRSDLSIPGTWFIDDK